MTTTGTWKLRLKYRRFKPLSWPCSCATWPRYGHVAQPTKHHDFPVRWKVVHSGELASGIVRHCKSTAQAFSHFTWEFSKATLLVCDIQGVGNFFTDPQIHSHDSESFSMGNLGQAGIDKFFRSHRCNTICKLVGLAEPVFRNGRWEIGHGSQCEVRRSVLRSMRSENGDDAGSPNWTAKKYDGALQQATSRIKEQGAENNQNRGNTSQIPLQQIEELQKKLTLLIKQKYGANDDVLMSEREDSHDRLDHLIISSHKEEYGARHRSSLDHEPSPVAAGARRVVDSPASGGSSHNFNPSGSSMQDVRMKAAQGNVAALWSDDDDDGVCRWCGIRGKVSRELCSVGLRHCHGKQCQCAVFCLNSRTRGRSRTFRLLGITIRHSAAAVATFLLSQGLRAWRLQVVNGFVSCPGQAHMLLICVLQLGLGVLNIGVQPISQACRIMSSSRPSAQSWKCSRRNLRHRLHDWHSRRWHRRCWWRESDELRRKLCSKSGWRRVVVGECWLDSWAGAAGRDR